MTKIFALSIYSLNLMNSFIAAAHGAVYHPWWQPKRKNYSSAWRGKVLDSDWGLLLNCSFGGAIFEPPQHTYIEIRLDWIVSLAKSQSCFTKNIYFPNVHEFPGCT
jgi:hypothetical protein